MRREIERERGNGNGETALPLPARIARIVRRIIGAPDYDAYLEHCRGAGHPAQLSEREYVAQFLEAKGKGVRCC